MAVAIASKSARPSVSSATASMSYEGGPKKKWSGEKRIMHRCAASPPPPSLDESDDESDVSLRRQKRCDSGPRWKASCTAHSSCSPSSEKTLCSPPTASYAACGSHSDDDESSGRVCCSSL